MPTSLDVLLMRGALNFHMMQTADTTTATAQSIEPEVIAALIIAVGGVIAATIAAIVQWRRANLTDEQLERTQTRLEDAVRDIAGLPYGIPLEFVDEVKHLRQLLLYRRDYEIDYSFEDKDDGSGDMLLTVEARYTLVNYGPGVATHPFRVRVIPVRPEETNRLLFVGASGKDLLLEEPIAISYPTEQREQTRFARDVQIRPNRHQQDNLFCVRYLRDCQRSDTDGVFLSGPTTSMTIRLKDSPPDLDFDVAFSHRIADQAETHSGVWRLRKAFLPWQGATVKWNRPHRKSITVSPAG